MKRCSLCKEVKPFEEFSPRKSSKDGYQYQCKKCRNKRYYDDVHDEERAKRKQKYWENPEKKREQGRLSYYRNHESNLLKRRTEKHREAIRIYRKKNPERMQEQRKRNYENTEKEWIKSLYEAKPWVRIHHCILTRTNNRAHPYYHRGIKNFLTVSDVEYLFNRDNGWSMEKPSIDRIDSSSNYTLRNCRIIELTENLKRQKTKGRD